MIAAPTWLKALARRAFDTKAQQTMPAAVMPTAAPAAGKQTWQALPGQVIELGGTGFQIVMDVSPNRPLYVLRAPEGWPIYSGADLTFIKQLGERFAAERDEFVCKPQVMKW